MSVAAKHVALVLGLALAATTLSVACASAQVGPYNPSGGTGCRQTVEEGRGTFSTAGLLSRNLTFDLGWRSWFAGSATSRSAVSLAAVSWGGRWQAAIVRRSSAGR